MSKEMNEAFAIALTDVLVVIINEYKLPKDKVLSIARKEFDASMKRTMKGVRPAYALDV